MFSRIFVVVAAILAALLLTAAAPVQQTHTGQATFFTPGLGSCGTHNKESDMIVAISASLFRSLQGATANPNHNPVCGKTITAKFKGKSTTVKVVDSCPGCSQFDLDLSPAAFRKLADPSVGRLKGVTCHFNS